MNYATDELCLPDFGCTVPGFNEHGIYVENPHYFNELMFLKMEQNIERESVFTTYHDTSGIQSETSEYETDAISSESTQSSDEETPSFAPPSFYIIPIGSFSQETSSLDVTELILLGLL